MRFVTDLNKGILGKPDPKLLWEEIISSIPEEIFLRKDLKILNTACGHALESDVIVKRMLALGRTQSEIKDSIYLLDKYSVFTKDAKRKGYTNIIQADFLNWETDMKFDVVVGNPPFKDPRGKNAIYQHFYNKSYQLTKDDGYVALITPPTLFPGLFGYKVDGTNMERAGTVHLLSKGNRVQQHFPNIGVPIGYSVVQKTEEVKDNYVELADDGTIQHDTYQLLQLQKYVADPIVKSIVNKCFDSDAPNNYNGTSADIGKINKSFVEKVGGNFTAIASIKAGNNPVTYQVEVTKEKLEQLKKKNKDFDPNGPKFIVAMLGTSYVIDYAGNMLSGSQTHPLGGHGVITYCTKTAKEAEALRDLCKSSLCSFFKVITQEGRSPYSKFLKYLKKVDLTSNVTDLKSLFNLTDDELKKVIEIGSE
jgi:hypothetical protein